MPYKTLEKKREKDNSYQRRAREAERARQSSVAAAAAKLSASDDFASWLSSVLTTHSLSLAAKGKGSSSPTTILAERLGKDDAIVGRWRRGAAAPGEDLTFATGVALRQCGVAWCSGAYALRKRGFWGAELSFLDFLDRRGYHALVLAYLEAAEEVARREKAVSGAALDRARQRLALVMREFASIEEEMHGAWKRRPSKSGFGLLGAVHHLVFESRLDPRDIDDAAEALLQKWMTRPRSQNLQDLIAAKFGELKDAT